MLAEEIVAAASDQLLPIVEDVDPATATLVHGFVVISGRAALPLNGVSWSLDRSNDIPIRDELDSNIGTLCLVHSRPPLRVTEMTRWQYTAYLVDSDSGEAGGETYQFARDYVVIDEAELERYISHYMVGSALWGGFSHGPATAVHPGWKNIVQARPNVVAPTSHHQTTFVLTTQATGPREQFLKLYHTIELLFDYVTFRKLTKCGNDLDGFGKIMAAYQRSELDKLRAIIREFCCDLDGLRNHIAGLLPYIDRAEQIFQDHTKEGNPLDARKWTTFRELIEAGTLDSESLKKKSLAGNTKALEDLLVGLTAYFIYRLRSSIAHSRIGEYILTEADDEFVAHFGIGLIEEVTMQVFGSSSMVDLAR